MAEAAGVDVVVEGGIAVVRPTAGAGRGGLARVGEQALGQLASFGAKGLRGLVVDLRTADVQGGAAHAAAADAFAPVLASWEARGLAVAVVTAPGRASLEAARVVAQSAPRWGRAATSWDDALRWVGGR